MDGGMSVSRHDCIDISRHLQNSSPQVLLHLALEGAGNGSAPPCGGRVRQRCAGEKVHTPPARQLNELYGHHAGNFSGNSTWTPANFAEAPNGKETTRVQLPGPSLQ
ncbi:hypothetical protein N7516_003304 [Penicillium verrucosum]|uniref:uncharacterized protein n=1 Tax=Penicillium verrucosum TaxID=60171 RepID=UPI0025450095|nr:uncharacterized protein N7516_003304 [Penicillium verrucosum]KAJ5943136.1 hypothetical protein N7516_003304 [Penicillium verrucosum]